MVLRGNYKGNIQYREVLLLEILLPPVSVDRVLALAASYVARGEGFKNEVDPGLVSAPIRGVSCNDPPVQSPEDEVEKKALIGNALC